MSQRRKEMEKGGMVALFPQHNRFSWPEQSQSLQPHKTNGGKSQPGGFDPLKGLWDLINMQLYLFIWFCSQCLSHTLIFTRINKNIWSMWIKYQPLAEHSQEGTKTRVHTLQPRTHAAEGSRSHKNIQLIAPWLRSQSKKTRQVLSPRSAWYIWMCCAGIFAISVL